MQLTAAVINAGLGDLSLGLERAGFRVVAAYEMEEKAVKIHQFNLETPVYKMPVQLLDLLQKRECCPASSPPVI